MMQARSKIKPVLGWEQRMMFHSVRGIAKAFRQTIHWMVYPLCLLTFPEGRFASRFYGGQPPRPRRL